VDLNRKLLTTACAILLLAAAVVGLRMLAGRNTVGAVTQGEIIINGSDFNWTVPTENSSDLINAVQVVTSRIIREYSDANNGFGLQGSESLNQMAKSVQPRIIVEYADYATASAFSTYLGPRLYSNNTTPPSIVVTREPSGSNVTEYQSVSVSANVTDAESGVEDATLQYTTDNSTNWSGAQAVVMSLNLTHQTQNSLALSFNATIPGQASGTRVRFRVIAYNFAGNSTQIDGVIDTTTYLVVPEFPSISLLSLFMIATLGAVVVHRRRHSA
jgi:hypothetical protein